MQYGDDKGKSPIQINTMFCTNYCINTLKDGKNKEGQADIFKIHPFRMGSAFFIVTQRRRKTAASVRLLQINKVAPVREHQS